MTTLAPAGTPWNTSQCSLQQQLWLKPVISTLIRILGMVLVISTAKCCWNLIKTVHYVLSPIHILYKKDIFYNVKLILLTQYTILHLLPVSYILQNTRKESQQRSVLLEPAIDQNCQWSQIHNKDPQFKITYLKCYG